MDDCERGRCRGLNSGCFKLKETISTNVSEYNWPGAISCQCHEGYRQEKRKKKNFKYFQILLCSSQTHSTQLHALGSLVRLTNFSFFFLRTALVNFV